MKLRKFLVICTLVACLIALFAIAINAEQMQVTPVFIESITTDADEGTTWGSLDALFDGNISSGGGWFCSNGWACPAGKSATVTFADEIEITSATFYGWSNWSSTIISFYDSEGNKTYEYVNSGFQSTDGGAIDLGVDVPIKAKTMVMQTISSKGLRNHTYTEFVIMTNHEHSYKTLDHMLVLPSCSATGIGEFSCICGAIDNLPIDPTGEHTEEQFIAFRNGFNNVGYLVNGCPTCDTQDKPITEIGALFNVIGYSVSEFGANGISYGFAVNYDNIATYTEIQGYGIEFGIVAYSTAAFSEGSPLLISEEGLSAASNKVICKNMTETGYELINYKVAGFADSYKDADFVVGGYVFDGLKIYYLNETSTDNPVSVSYNSIISNSGRY